MRRAPSSAASPSALARERHPSALARERCGDARRRGPAALAGALLALAGGARAGELAWDAARVEHLLNRAGFGGSSADVARGLSLGPEALVDELLAPGDGALFSGGTLDLGGERRRLRGLDEEARREELRLLRRDDREQLEAFLDWWAERLVSSPAVVEERMTLFWHGLLPSSQQDVQSSLEMIAQHELLRTNALGSFATILRGIARDPAMLEYLDNDENKKASPNENFARELLELFTLGAGHYEEADVAEVARAFTGWTDRDGVFVVLERLHDDGEKRILGRRGRFGGDEVLDLLLERDDCARHLAARLLRHFEGVEPARARVERTARLLRREGWELRPVLRALFLDPDFYRAEARAARVTSPLDFLVGIARRTRVAPPPRLLVEGAALLGERLCYPPNVAGWKGGTDWITSGSLLLRGNLAGVLVGAIEPQALLELRGEAGGGAGLGALGRLRWKPRLSLARALRDRGAASDDDVAALLADDLLAVPPAPDVHARVAAFLARRRAAAGLEEASWLERAGSAEPVLRSAAHFVLSLPEAQLH